jgi:hypothetical protein
MATAETTNQDIRHFRRRLAVLENERKSWEPHWRQLAENFMPRRARFLDAGDQTNKGDRRNHLWDGTGILARRTLSSGMQTGLTSPARPWFSLTLQNGDLAKLEAVKFWLHDVYERMVNVFSQSNFYDQIHLLYDELGTFGTGVLLLEEGDTGPDPDDYSNLIRCRTLTVGEYCLDTDAAGRVDTLYRRVRMSARQVLQAWPDTCPERIRNLAEQDTAEWLDVLHIVEPRKIRAAGRKDGPNRPWRSVFMLLESGRPKDILDDSGYFEFPALAPRWNTTASDVYGSSPAMDALGDCLTLQALARDGVLALEMEIKPPLLKLAAAGLTRINLTPGAINDVSAMSSGGALPSVTPLYQVRANLAALEQYKAAIKDQIKRMFFNDLFMMLAQTDKPMTAREVSERNAEKMLMLGPVLDRLRSELFQPLIQRVFGIMWRAGKIPAPPREMLETNAGFSIEFISILALAQKQAGLAGINSTVAFAGGAAQMNPEILDKINFDEAMDEVAEMNGVPPNLLRSDEDVAKLRQQRAEQMAQQQQMMQMAQMAGVAKEGAGALKDSGLSEALAGAEGGGNA